MLIDETVEVSFNDKGVLVLKKKKPEGHFIQGSTHIDCYGKIEEDSNFEVICEDEMGDGIVNDIDTTVYNTWLKVCKYLVENYRTDIVEITSC